MRLILASASPRRAELLTAAGYEFDVRAVDVDEAVHAGESPEAYVERLAGEKAEAAWAAIAGAPEHLRQGYGGPPKLHAKAEGRHYDRGGRDGLDCQIVVLAADTTVVVDGEILAKPMDDADARRMLELLSGRPHQVLTGVAARSARHVAARVETTEVVFAKLSNEDIDWYVQSGEGRDKAGGYGIQGLASRFVAHIHGSYSNVVGLPIATVHALVTDIRRRAEKC